MAYNPWYGLTNLFHQIFGFVPSSTDILISIVIVILLVILLILIRRKNE